MITKRALRQASLFAFAAQDGTKLFFVAGDLIRHCNVHAAIYVNAYKVSIYGFAYRR